MAILERISTGIKKGRDIYDHVTSDLDQSTSEAFGVPEIMNDNLRDVRSELYLGDNIEYMRNLMEAGYIGKFRLIYIDPPFFTRSSFNASVSLKDTEGRNHQVHHLAYDDKFDRNLEYYIENMTVRLMMMKDLLADDGTMWVHLDWHSSHYIKLVMDEIMGEQNFVNEIVWCYKSGGSGKRHFARKHDTLLAYAKSKNYYLNVPLEKSYNRDHKPYRFKGVEEFKDDVGWYTMVNMKDVWNIDMVGRTSKERTGYATQKPQELMRRIVESCSEEGDLVGDFFCGSGSLPEAAESLGRKWKACDSEKLATSMTKKRLAGMGADFEYSSEDSSESEHGKAAIEIVSTDELEDGRYMYKCRLTDLVPEIEIGSIQLKDREYVNDAMSSDRLQFADYVIAVRGDGTVSYEMNPCDIMIVSDEIPAFRVVDIFGKEYFADVDNTQTGE